MKKRIAFLLFLIILVLDLSFCVCDSDDVYMDKPVKKENGDDPVGGTLEPYSLVNSSVMFIGLVLLLNLLFKPKINHRINGN